MQCDHPNSRQVLVYERPPEHGGDPTTYWVAEDDFEIAQPRKGRGSSLNDVQYVLVGFDTEFKTPNYRLTSEEIRKGEARSRILSYQFHAKLSDGDEWSGICCTEGDKRISIADFLTFVFGKAAREQGRDSLPRTVFLVGHFTRADIPAFEDFKDHTNLLCNVRNTFLNIDKSITINLGNDDKPIDLKVIIRDTMLLTPQTSKSLQGIGELIGFQKQVLDQDPAKHREMIKNMDRVRTENWDVYRSYALMDASICVHYIEKIINQYEQVTGKKKVPVTLTSIGVDLLLKSWAEILKIDPVTTLGKETVTTKLFDKKAGYYRYSKELIDIEELSHHVDFITQSYHGGRNEQYWFGPGFEDDWIDLDLASAYPTGMSLIGLPDWRNIRESKRISDFTATTLGFVWVDFKFPPNVRYPTLPVRTDNGLIFPQEGTSYCAAPEIVVARSLGCRIKIRRGVIVPTNSQVKIFGGFIKDCIEKRRQAGSKTLEGLFWKEISNSTYGKTAQGLRKKRVYDMRDRETRLLHPSRITNPCFASYITSFARAVLGEIMNSIDGESQVFSCTTDGFITNFPESRIAEITSGPLATLYATARKELVNDSQMLEIKHEIRQPLGWRTRGQATLKHHPRLIDMDSGTILAKGGIFTRPESETVFQRNEEIVELFFERRPDSEIVVESLTGVRDIVEFDADLVPKQMSKRLSMEYDWKRRPVKLSVSDEYGHVQFSTSPWRSVGEFVRIRDLWDEYTKNSPRCIKTIEDYNAFADFVECKGLPKEKSRYLRKEQPDINRLRNVLCQAWQQSRAGIIKDPTMTARQFAEVLESIGIPCNRANVENGAKKTFEARTCIPTEKVKSLLVELKREHFPKMKTAELLVPKNLANSISIKIL